MHDDNVDHNLSKSEIKPMFQALGVKDPTCQQ